MKRLNRMRKQLPKSSFIIVLSLLMIGITGSTVPADASPIIDLTEQDVSQGALRVKIRDEIVECPLKHTDVKVNISGFIARATVTQTFYNPYHENIEAIYVFPLPHTAAVDAMTMKTGERTVIGVMKRRAEARAIYEQAIQQGKTASLLEQERPNIFTQSVGNIKPNAEIHIEISYVDVLAYDVGTYEFHFPMVVGPRYIPGDPISEKPQLPKELAGKVGEVEDRVREVTLNPDPSGTGWSPDTNRVPDASRITPPVLKPGYRTGHDIRLSVSLDAGVPIQDIEIVNHAAALERIDASKARVEISPMDAIPNKDFVMKYKVAGEKPEMAVFAHATGPEQRYFMLMIQPKLDAELAKTPPREIVFLVDVSGSMSGEPMAKVRAAMRHFFQLSKPNDTFQVITFANQANSLFEKPVSATEANIARALTFTQQFHGGGGTEMLRGVKAVLNAPVDPKRVRIVVMLTDGYIGNEEEIIAEVGRRTNDSIRFWTIGIGSSPNRLLIDGVAKQSGGMSGVLDLNTNPKALVTQIVERIHRAQLAHIQMDWKQLTVYETYPRRIPELWAGRPVILFGRYAAGGETEIALSGTAEGEPLTYAVDVTLPDADPTNDVLAKVWARKKIEDLSAQAYDANMPAVVEEITRIALDYRLMSQYTSFVAIDESEISDLSQQPTPPRQVVVPVPLPEGVDFQGVFGAMEEEPQFFYDLFGAERLENTGPLLGRRNGLNEKSSGYYGYGFRGRYTEFAADARKYLKPNYHREPERIVLGWTGTLETQESTPDPTMFYRGPDKPTPDFSFQKYRFRGAPWMVQHVLGTWAVKRHADAKVAIADAHALQQAGHLEAARLRYQHVLGLMAGVQAEDDTLATATVAIQSLSDAILEKRVEAHPGLNQKLNMVIRNQHLADAIRTLVNAGGFHLDLVPGSLADVKALLWLPECRVTYLDLRHAPVGQALEWLLAPYHLTWRMRDEKTITVGTTRRMSGDSVWGYDVRDIAIPWLNAEYDEAKRLESVENTLAGFLKTLKIVIASQVEVPLKPHSVVLIPHYGLLVYGDPDIHQQVNRLLEMLRESSGDIATIAQHGVTEETTADLEKLQRLTTAQSKTFTETRKLVVLAKTHQRIVTDLETGSWQLLAAAIQGEIHREALTRLQMAWEAPQLKAVIEREEYRGLGMRSAWCICTAAQAVPTDMELAALSKRALSKIKQTDVLKWRESSFESYLGRLYAVLTFQTQDARNTVFNTAMKALLRIPGNADLRTAHLVAEGLLSPSQKSDKALQAALSAREIYGDDLVLLTCLIAKRRGGQLWQTFHQELRHITQQHPLSGHILVILSRLAASHSPI